MGKKLYYRLSDTADAKNVTMELDDCMKWIEEDMKHVSEADADEFEYTLSPIWLTEDEFDNLTEADI